MNVDTITFVENLQKVLSQTLCLNENPLYIDLSIHNEITKEMLEQYRGQLPPSDPLTQALALILATMEKGPFELTRLGINELLKSYIFVVQKENEEVCTRSYLNCIYQIYLFGLSEHYPYTDIFWENLILCFDTISRYLINQSLLKASQVFLNKVSTMGKRAAQQGLHTSSIQHSLHNMEIWAREEGFEELADSAKNHRFNLETF